MATRRNDPPGKADLADLKARLGLARKGGQAPAPAPDADADATGPGDRTMVSSAPVAPQGAVQINLPPAAAPVHPHGLRPAGPPPGGPPAPTHAPQGGPPPAARPPFAGPPGGPPARPPRPAPAKPDWNPPAIDTAGASDVPIKSHKGILPVLGFAAGVVVMSLFFGLVAYYMGGATKSRALYDAQTREAQALLDFIKPKVDKVKELEGVVSKSNPTAPDMALMEELAKVDYAVKPEELVTVAGGRLLVGAQQTDLLVKFTADTQLIANLAKEHVRMTTKVDQKELEEIAADKTLSGRGAYAVIFNADEYTQKLNAKEPGAPVKGAIAIVDSEPFEKDKEPWVKVRYPSSGKVFDTPLRSLVHVDKEQIQRSGGPNAVGRYTRRQGALVGKVSEVTKYGDTMVTQLEAIASRGAAPILTFSK